jgi:peptidoglycan hydrolase CwlO-like protein
MDSIFKIMEVEQKDIVITLKDKIKKLLSLYNDLKAENAQLKSQKEENKTIIKNKEAELDFLQNKYNKLKLAKSLLASTGDSHDAKIKINGIVREIDKCIALLNR